MKTSIMKKITTRDYTESTTEDEDLREEEYWDNITYRYRNNNYNWRERDNPCHDAYYNQDEKFLKIY